MSFDYGVSQINQSFLEVLTDPSMKKEAEDRGGEFLKLQVYEDSFMERIWPAKPISPSQCDRDTHSPNLRVVIDKEFRDVKATTFTLRGRPLFNYVEADRYAVEFYKIASDEVGITEEELRGMRQPIQNLIRRQIAYRIRKTMDEIFIGLCNAAVSDSGQHLDLSAGTVEIITPEVLTKLFNLIDNSEAMGRDGQYLESKSLLMTRSMFNYINTWPQADLAGGATMRTGLGTEFWRDGYKYEMLFGRRVITTTKNDLLAENEIFCFTDPDMIGHHFTFNDDRLSIETRHDRLSMVGWRTFGAAIGNNAAIAKLTLAPIDYTP